MPRIKSPPVFIRQPQFSYHQDPQGTPKTKVELVDYIQELSRVKDILMDYEVNQAETQERLALPRPEMVEMFDKILALLGVEQMRVKITASHCCVLLSGPRCLVQEALQHLRAALAFLTWKDLVLNEPGAHQYFQNEGRRSMEIVQSSCNVLIAEKQDDIKVALGGGVQLQLVFGNISNETTDIVVNTTNFKDFDKFSVCKNILDIAGPQVKAKLKSARVERGQIFETESGQFPCKAIFHVSGQNDAGVIQSLVYDIIESCDNKKHRSVAIPAIGTGMGKMDAPVVADAIFKGVQEVVRSTTLHCVTTIRLVLIGKKMFLTFKELLEQFFGPFVLNHDPPIPMLLIVGTDHEDIINAEAELNELYKEENELYGTVAWCILGAAGDWERLPKTANYWLEKGELSGGVVDGNQNSWSVDIRNMEARDQRTSRVTRLKRLDILPDFSPLLYWDNMAADEQLKTVTLEPTSPEYRRVKEGFTRTATLTVLTIERLQNIHLRRGYEVLKKQISDRNLGGAGAGEKMLYHGTTHDNCQSIMETGFNRSFAGQNAIAYGMGTYFAVDASYSANPTYSMPGPDGSRLMFVARVLTGSYTLGQSDMKVPPPRDPQQPNDRFDSVVDNIQNPSMFVVFHDNQAYPDYLITFK